MWIHAPTNVTIMIITADSVSSRNAGSALKLPTSSHDHAVCAMPPVFQYGTSLVGGCWNSAQNTMMPLSTHDAATAPTAIVCTHAFGSRRPSVRLMNAPASGSTAIHASAGRPAKVIDSGSTSVSQGGERVAADV